MKLFIFSLIALIGTNSLASSCPLDFLNKLEKIKCPTSLTKQNTNTEILVAESFIEKLNKTDDAKVIYFDVLRNLKESEEIKTYINEDNFKELSQTEIFEKLLVAKTLKQDDRYTRLLEKVSPYNKYWCVSLEGDIK